MPITHLTPQFYRQFHCIGGACQDNCCHGWTIHIDRQSLRHYLSHPDPELKRLAGKHIRKVRKSDAVWGEIRLDKQGACPFLASDGLCVIHSKAGAAALSNTCQGYPRLALNQGGERRHSLTISCPEACRQLLLNPAAMQLTVAQLRGHSDAPALPPTHQALQPLALHLALNGDLAWELRVWIIGMLVHRDEQSLSHPAFINQLADIAEQGELIPHFEQLPSLPALHWWGLRALSHQLQGEQNSHKRGHKTMALCMERLYRHFEGECDESKVATLYQQWQQTWQPWLAERPHIINNYLLYWLYHHGFPQAERAPAESYRLLVVDLFLLRAYLCLLTLDGEAPDEEKLVALFYSYHAQRQHNRGFVDALQQSLANTGLSSDIALYALLRCGV